MRLLAPGLARQLRRGDTVIAWLAGDRLWWLHDGVLQVRAVGADEALELDRGQVFLVGPRRRLHLNAAAIEAPRARWGSSGWTTRSASPLPYGARWSAHLHPFAAGLVWVDEGWLYRWPTGGRVRALGRVTEGVRLAVGPEGAVLVGDEEGFFQGCPPRASGLQDLPVALERGWGVVFDGHRVLGLAKGQGGYVELNDNSWVPGPRGARPVAPGHWLRRDRGGGLTGWSSGTQVWQAPWLAGPGGRIWNLDTGEALTPRVSVRSGTTGFVGERLYTADRDGAGVWVHLTDGAVAQGAPPSSVTTPSVPQQDWTGGPIGHVRRGDRHYVVSAEGLLAELTPRDASTA